MTDNCRCFVWTVSSFSSLSWSLSRMMSQETAGVFFFQVSKAPSVPINQPHSTARSDKSVFQLFLCGFVQFVNISWAKWLQLTRYSHWGFMDLESTGLASIFHSRKETRKFRCCLPSRVVGNSQSWQCGCRDTDVKQNGVNEQMSDQTLSSIELHSPSCVLILFNYFYVSIVKRYVLFIWGHGSLDCKFKEVLLTLAKLCIIWTAASVPVSTTTHWQTAIVLCLPNPVSW